MSRYFNSALGLTAAVVCVSVVGCSKVNSDNLSKIKPGQTEAEVDAILGSPTKTDSVTIPGASGASKKTWESGNKSIVVTFVSGKVLTVNGNGL